MVNVAEGRKETHGQYLDDCAIRECVSLSISFCGRSAFSWVAEKERKADVM